MGTISNVKGHNIYYDKVNSCWKYEDNNEIFDKNNERLCKKCGNKSTDKGHDSCLGHLGIIINACCGHGINEGYLQFDCGTTIRGNFKIERLQK